MLFVMNLLSGLNFGRFFQSTLGKVATGIALTVAAYIGFTVWLDIHDGNIRDAAKIEFNLEQEEIAREAQEDFDRRMADILREEAARLDAVRAERDALERQSSDLMDRINSGEFAGRDDEASEILRETIRRLQTRSRQ